MDRISKALLIICLFVCPLLFFTDLTRNPYFTQIALLNIAVLGIVAAFVIANAREEVWVLPRTPLDIPLGVWILVCGLTWTWSYFHHLPFFRIAIRSEGLRVFSFTLVNTVVPFYAAALVMKRPSAAPAKFSLARWVVFSVAWGFLWMLFHSMRTVGGPPLDIWPHVWDPYGGFVWLLGIAAAGYLIWEGSWHDYWHLIMAVGFLSSVYGIAQYFNTEWIWPKVLNPYGGRSVSTFGNPNFMSSYMVLLVPVVVAYYLQAKTLGERIVYSVVFFAIEGCLVSSLTRSSWVGALVALGVVFTSKELRKACKENLEFHGLVVAIAVAMILFWPQSTVSGYTPSVLGRVQELSAIADTKSGAPYSPLYQRVLIWTSAWLMGRENPLLGNGWGLFELFYPFYQGHLVLNFDLFHGMRTHANNAHNEIMEVWSQTGILGVGVLIWIWTVFFTSAKKWLKEFPTKDGVWVIASLAGVAGMLADNMLNVSLHFAVPAFLFWWQSGCVMGSAANIENRGRSVRFPKPGLSAVVAVLITGACLSGAWWWVGQWNREVNYFMGFKLMRVGGLSAAVQKLEEAYRWNPREVNVDYELGNAYARSQMYPKAVWAYQEAINSNSGYDEIYFNLGTILFQRMNKPEEALNNYLLSFLINPFSVELYTNLNALYLQNIGKYGDAAIELMEHAVHIYPNQQNFLNSLGYLYSLKRDYQKAEEMWVRVIEQDPDQVYAIKNLEAMSRETGGPRPAVLNGISQLRDLEGRLGKHDYSPQSLELARKIAKQFPKSIKARFYLGNLELLNGHADTALEYLEPLLQLEPRNVALLQNLGETYLHLGRTQDALRTFHAVQEIEPGNPYAAARLSQIQPH